MMLISPVCHWGAFSSATFSAREIHRSSFHRLSQPNSAIIIHGAAKESQNARIVLWEQPPGTEFAALLEEQFGLQCVVFRTCEHPPEPAKTGDDYLTVMSQNIDALKAAF